MRSLCKAVASPKRWKIPQKATIQNNKNMYYTRAYGKSGVQAAVNNENPPKIKACYNSNTLLMLNYAFVGRTCLASAQSRLYWHSRSRRNVKQCVENTFSLAQHKFNENYALRASKLITTAPRCFQLQESKDKPFTHTHTRVWE